MFDLGSLLDDFPVVQDVAFDEEVAFSCAASNLMGAWCVCAVARVRLLLCKCLGDDLLDFFVVGLGENDFFFQVLFGREVFDFSDKKGFYCGSIIVVQWCP